MGLSRLKLRHKVPEPRGSVAGGEDWTQATVAKAAQDPGWGRGRGGASGPRPPSFTTPRGSEPSRAAHHA